MSSEKLIAFKTSNGEEFKLNEAVAVRSEIIKNMVQNVDCTSNVIPLSNVDGNVMSSEKLITLKTSDDEEFKLNKSVAIKSEVIKSLVQDIDSNVIPLPNVDGKTMTKVINYWKKHSEKGVTEIQLKNFDQDFLKMSHSELFDVHLAARYLDDKQLEEVIIQESFDRITGKTLEEIREVFGIVNDYTPEEEEQVRRENAWAFK
ncbi:SKP1-like protein 11 [Solanum stenotomum]|uniref:SKP1-like protein 11 n=1 Tax=Solanum stenotomum TaxID=172797 RepID=UPI0020D117B5|nr:SKP1-like protein 11 [Solanum stenotomum]